MKTPDPLQSQHLIRTYWLIFFAFILLLAMIARIAHLQITEYNRYHELAEGNRTNSSIIPPLRGRIYDRNGILLAGQRLKYNLVVIPEKTRAGEQPLLQALQKAGWIDQQDILAYQRSRARFRGFDRIYLKTFQEDDALAQFTALSHLYPGAQLEVRLTRHYPHAESLAHLLGYVGRINREDEAQFTPQQKARYKGSLYIGRMGIEQAYEKRLHGYPGALRFETNAVGRYLKEIDRQPAQNGEDLHLTLDYRLHAYAYQLLEGRKGSVVVMHNKTGEILALVSRPAYNPNLFVDGISVSQYQALLHNPQLPLLDRSLQGQYPPGSTFKPMVAFAGLEAGLIDPQKKIKSEPFFQLKTDPRKYRDWKKEGHGLIDFNRAMAVSSDYFFYDLAHQLDIEPIAQAARAFGMGEKTGIDLPHEKAGLVPTPAWKKDAKGEIWFPGETLITGIGQGYLLTTPLQLTYATSLLANQGRAPRPYLVTPSQQAPLEISTQKANTWPLLHRSLESVVHRWYGTAHSSIGQHLNYRMAGKTGTAQVFGLGEEENYDEAQLPERLRDHALFIAYAPAQDPEVSIAVVIENGGSGSKVAAPIARKVLDYYFQLGQLAPIPPHQGPQLP
jgi:penicillin-binding protein 2